MRDFKFNNSINGEINIIREEIHNLDLDRSFIQYDPLSFFNKFSSPLNSIQQKVGYNSIDNINISTEIVETISSYLLEITSAIDMPIDISQLTNEEIVRHLTDQKITMINAYKICTLLDSLNMDYSYRTREFCQTKETIENRCKKFDIDTRSTNQKTIDRLKIVGDISISATKEILGCSLEFILQACIVLIIFFIIMAIIGVK